MAFFDELKHLKTSAKDMQRFGLTVGGAFLILALITWWRGHEALFDYFLFLGLFLIVLGLTFSKLLRPVYRAWMGLAVILSFVMTRIILGVIFFLVLTPLALVAKLVGKQFIAKKFEPERKSYWIRREPRIKTKEEWMRQF